MEEKETLQYPSTGGSIMFSITFVIVYIIIIFSILAIFFELPF